MQRVLDLDLDFFVQPVEFWPSARGRRLSPDGYEVALGYDTTLDSVDVAKITGVDAALHYLRERLRLDHPIPGAAVEHHGEVFALWEQAVDDGTLRPPFHVTHVDAHGDFGEGQTSYERVFDDVLLLPPHARPARSLELLDDGDYLLHAVACQWIDAIDYVYCPKGGSDIQLWYWENFEKPPRRDDEGASGNVRLVALDKATQAQILTGKKPPVVYAEPPVRFEEIAQHAYRTTEPFDLFFLSRSPEFTPEAADPLYDAIRADLISDA